ncbi:MAG: hypothetical protein ACOC3Z_03670, partial [Nanoarchaeota archaeon]
MSFNYDFKADKEGLDFFTGRDLLVELAKGFSRCCDDNDKRKYVEKVNENKNVVLALYRFSGFHSTQQDVIYNGFAEKIRDFRNYRK